MCKSKLHRLSVTETNPDYAGSITIPHRLLKAANILPAEKVQVANITNGNRINTYTIAGNDPSAVCLNGAAARLFNVGDIILVISYALYESHDLENFQPTIVYVNENTNSPFK